jgi:hypothetical protein
MCVYGDGRLDLDSGITREDHDRAQVSGGGGLLIISRVVFLGDQNEIPFVYVISLLWRREEGSSSHTSGVACGDLGSVKSTHWPSAIYSSQFPNRSRHLST